MAAARRPLSVLLEVSDARIFWSDSGEIFAVSVAGLPGVFASCVCARIFHEKTLLSSWREIFAATAA